MPKLDPDKVAAEIQNMQQDLKNLQKALAELVDAMITEEKPGPKQIKKLKTLKKQALSGQDTTDKEMPISVSVRHTSPKAKRRNRSKASSTAEKAKRAEL